MMLKILMIFAIAITFTTLIFIICSISSNSDKKIDKKIEKIKKDIEKREEK